MATETNIERFTNADFAFNEGVMGTLPVNSKIAEIVRHLLDGGAVTVQRGGRYKLGTLETIDGSTRS